MEEFEGTLPIQEPLLPLSFKREVVEGVRLMNNFDGWSQIIEDVMQLPHQQDVSVPKDSVVHPQTVGIPYIWGAYRFTVPDGRAIDIKEDGNCYLVHWDWHNPDTHFIEHALNDAPLSWLLVATGIGAAISPEGRKDKGALRGIDLGLLLLLLRAIAVKN